MLWCKWEKLYLPKSLGGLNFKDIEGFNQALVAKQVLRIFSNPNSLVSRFFKSIYFSSSSILSADSGSNPTYLRRSLLWGRDLLVKGLRNRVGNGLSVLMFKDPWLPKETTFKPLCMDTVFANDKVVDFISPSEDWNLERLSRTVTRDDFEAIRRVPINGNLEDKLVWH